MILTSCIDIIDDLTINNDGSGTFKYTINLSSSKLKINSILALDSLDGRRVPDIEEIKARVASFEKRLEAKAGISNVKIESNYENFFFRLTCDFTSVNALQNAVRDVIKEESKEKNIPELNSNWITWDGSKLSRDIPEITVKKTQELKIEDIELLKQGKYSSITRFQRSIDRFDNPTAQLSTNKLAVMVKTNPYSLSQNPKLLENTIYLSSPKN